MEDLIKSLGEKFGIDPSKAADIVQHVMDFLKDKMPDVGNLLGNLTGGEGGAGGLADKAKDLLGGFMK